MEVLDKSWSKSEPKHEYLYFSLKVSKVDNIIQNRIIMTYILTWKTWVEGFIIFYRLKLLPRSLSSENPAYSSLNLKETFSLNHYVVEASLRLSHNKGHVFALPTPKQLRLHFLHLLASWSCFLLEVLLCLITNTSSQSVKTPPPLKLERKQIQC